MAVRKHPGILDGGPQAYIASGTAEFLYVPRKRHSTITVLTTATTAGTVRLFVRGPDGDQPLGAAVVVAANVQDSQQVTFPIRGVLRILYTDTSVGAGTVQCRVTDDGGR